MSEPVNFVVEHYDNEELAEANEQLAMMVAKLHIENAKLRQAFNETLARLIAANESTEVNYMDEDYCDLLSELGIEVGE